MIFNPSLFVLGNANGLNLGNILVQLVVFLALLALLRKFAWSKVIEMMKKREEHIASQIDAAEKNHQDSVQLAEEQREMLKQSRNEAIELIEVSKKQAEEQKDSIIATAKAEAANIREMALKDIEHEKNRAIIALHNEVAMLSVQIASKVIEKEIQPEAHTQIIQKYLDEVGDLS